MAEQPSASQSVASRISTGSRRSTRRSGPQLTLPDQRARTKALLSNFVRTEADGGDYFTPRSYLPGESFTLNLQESSLFVFGAHNRYRRSLFFTIDSSLFERVVLVLITLNVFGMILDTPPLTKIPGVPTAVFWVEIAFQALFSAEMILKIFVLGFVLHPYSYLRSFWNAGDCLIVAIGFASFFSPTLAALRLFRVLRLIRALSRAKLMKLILVALVNSGSRMADVLLLMLFVIVTMAIVTLQVLTTQRRCVFDVQENGIAKRLIDPLVAELPCGTLFGGRTCARGGKCERVALGDYFSYSNIGTALFTVVKVVTMDNWPKDCQKMQMAEGSAAFILAFAIVIFGGFFCLNLFLAILSSEYEDVTRVSENDGASKAAPVPSDTSSSEDSDDTTGAALRTAQPPAASSQGLLSSEGSVSLEVLQPQPPTATIVDRDSALHRGDIQETSTTVIRVAREILVMIVQNDWFLRFMLFVTAINVIALGLDHHGIHPFFERVLDKINLSCSIVFIVEMVLKVVGLGLKYFTDAFNIFDCFLALASIPEMIYSSGSGGSTLSALRGFRLARVMRVMNTSRMMRQLLLTVYDAAISSAFLFFVLLLFLICMGLLAVNFFGDSIASEKRPNFTTLPDALIALFVVLTGEDWVEIGVEVVHGSNFASMLFFYFYYGIGNYLLLNFVIVILIASFNQSADRLREEGVAGAANPVSTREASLELEMSIPRTVSVESSESASAYFAGEDDRDGETHRRSRDSTPPESQCGPQAATPFTPRGADPGTVRIFPPDEGHARGKRTLSQSSADTHFLRLSSSQALHHATVHTRSIADILSDELVIFDKAATGEKPRGEAFFLLSADGCLRQFVASIVRSPIFEIVVLLVIVYSCVTLGFDNPSNTDNDSIQWFLTISNYILVVFFVAEAVLRSVAWGAFLGDGTYLSDNWNRLDFFVLLTSIVAIPIPQLRALRSLRAFRLAAKIRGVRVLLGALLAALPGLVNVALLLLFAFVVFGILGVQLFKGRFVSCNDPTIQKRHECVGNFTISTSQYHQTGGLAHLQNFSVVHQREWQHAFFNFNHVGQAMLTLLQQMYGDGWSTVMYNGMDSVSYDEALKFNARPYMSAYFVIFMIVGNFFLNNLFVGSLIDSVSHERSKRIGIIDARGTPLLSEAQEMWIKAYRVLSASRLNVFVPGVGCNPVRRFCAWLYFADYVEDRVAPRPTFDYVVTILILLNAAVMCATHDNQPPWLTEVLTICNWSFAALFALEAVIKIVAMLPHAFFTDSWNWFDVVIVVLSFASAAINIPGASALRVLRVLRLFRLIKRAQGLHRLFNSLMYALPQLMNVGMFLALTLFVFGVVATSLFANVYINPNGNGTLNEYFNFRNAGMSMVLLFQISTTESWSDVMEACSIKENNSNCTGDSCGNPYLAVPFFVVFMLCANSVAINLFIFVIVDNYMEVNRINDSRSVTLTSELGMLRTYWSFRDPESTGLIHWRELVHILIAMRQEDIEGEEELNNEVDDETEVSRAPSAALSDVESVGKAGIVTKQPRRSIVTIGRGARASIRPHRRSVTSEIAGHFRVRNSAFSVGGASGSQTGASQSGTSQTGVETEPKMNAAFATSAGASAAAAASPHLVGSVVNPGVAPVSDAQRGESEAVVDFDGDSAGEAEQAAADARWIRRRERAQRRRNYRATEAAELQLRTQRRNRLARLIRAAVLQEEYEAQCLDALSTGGPRPMPPSRPSSANARCALGLHMSHGIPDQRIDTASAEIARSMVRSHVFPRLRMMDIAITTDGMVQYSACVLGITRVYYNLDDSATQNASKFLALRPDTDPTQLLNCFKVHHAYAVDRIASAWRRKLAASRARSIPSALNTSKKYTEPCNAPSHKSPVLIAHSGRQKSGHSEPDGDPAQADEPDLREQCGLRGSQHPLSVADAIHKEKTAGLAGAGSSRSGTILTSISAQSMLPSSLPVPLMNQKVAATSEGTTCGAIPGVNDNIGNLPASYTSPPTPTVALTRTGGPPDIQRPSSVHHNRLESELSMQLSAGRAASVRDALRHSRTSSFASDSPGTGFIPVDPS